MLSCISTKMADDDCEYVACEPGQMLHVSTKNYSKGILLSYTVRHCTAYTWYSLFKYWKILYQIIQIVFTSGEFSTLDSRFEFDSKFKCL